MITTHDLFYGHPFVVETLVSVALYCCLSRSDPLSQIVDIYIYVILLQRVD